MDRQAVEILERTTKKVDGHFETGLLWRDENIVLPNNRCMAVSRLHSTERKLMKHPQLAQKYQDVLDEYVAKEHCKKLSPQKAQRTSSKTWYLPHHAVFNINKPGKVRVVFDAAAKFDDISLNDCLLTGPDLLNNLVGILMRFRLGKTAVMGDVEKMFHQVGVIEDDRDSLRFLWRGLNIKQPPEEYQMLVHVFGAADSPCCASYALRKTAEDQGEKFSEAALRSVKRNFYMDDVLLSSPTPAETSNLAKQLIDILATGGFRLTKWVSNSREVLLCLPKSELASGVVDLDRSDLPQERVLGVKWCLQQDTLFLNPLKQGFPDTKRGILSARSSVFDPLGLAAPYVIKAKLILQELWRLHLDWDDPLPEVILHSWRSWKCGLKDALAVKIPRWYGFHRQDAQDLQLHVFCDASEIATKQSRTIAESYLYNHS